MILNFKKQFVKKIKNKIKIHTIREDKHNRWKAGNTIHFATGVRTKKYKQFSGDICRGTQRIEINYYPGMFFRRSPHVFIDDRLLMRDEVEKLAINDGFDSADEFFAWFNKDFIGKIVHWTNLKY